MMVIALLISVVSIIYDDFNLERDWELFLITQIVLIALLGYVMYTTLKKLNKNLETFTIILDGENVVRTQAKSTLTIPVVNISRISENKKGTLYIIGKNNTDVIPVSTYLKEYNELKACLYEIKAFETTKSDVLWQKFGWIAAVLPVILMMAVFISDNKYVVGIGGILAVGAIGWFIIKIFQMSQSNKSLRSMPYMLMLFLIAVLLKMFFTLPFLVDLLSHL